MRRITPSKLGSRDQVAQLGSTEAVLEAMGWEGVLIVSNAEAAERAFWIWQKAGRGSALRTVAAGGGPNLLYEIPKTTVIGVDVDAFVGVPQDMWADMQVVLSSRFKTVHWG